MSDDTCCCKRPAKKEDANETTGGETKKKTILFVPLDCVGHVNSLISIADTLKQAGHRTVFLFYDPMDGGLSKNGHEVYDCTCDELVPSRPTDASERKWDMIVCEMGKLWRAPLMDNYRHTTRVGLGSMMKDIMRHEERIAHKLDLIKPDVIVIDHYFIQPALIKLGVPWIRVFSASPLALHPRANKLPPAFLGLPTNWLDTRDEAKKREYLDLARQCDESRREIYDEFNDFLTKIHNMQPLPLDPISFSYTSPHMNVYMCAEELDYAHVPAPQGWTRCDSILRCNAKLPSSDEDDDNSVECSPPAFDVPAQLKDKPGKLILLSMGSLASGDVELMKRLVGILRKSPHRFIVSRGPNWDKYELADNMWGEKFLPQLSILPVIDMIITHGGNNSITECFYYGVPGFVVCPIFSDQYDNAQRVQEIGVGRRINPFDCGEQELLDAVEQVLADVHQIRPKMRAISERMQKPCNKYKAIRLFKDFVDKL